MIRELTTMVMAAHAAAILGAGEITLNSSSDFYAGRPSAAVVEVPGGAGKQLSWSVSFLGATTASGTQAIPASGSVKLVFTFPQTSPGVVAEGALKCSAAGMTLSKPLRFYPENPFADQKEFLRKMAVEVWAASDDDRLAELLAKLEVPFRAIDNLSAFDGKTLLVSGVDFDAFPGAGEDLRKIAAKGALVVALAPAGALGLDFNLADQVTLGANAQILKFDKKLDCEFWGEGVPAAKALRLGAEDDSPTLEVVDAQRTKLTFCQARYGLGAVIVTTWDVAGKAELSPTPVYLLAKIFERFTYLALPEESASKGNERVIELLK